MDSQTKVFRAHRLLSWLYAALALLVLSVLIFFGTLERDGAGLISIALIIALVSALHHYTARACRQGKPWGRKASIAIACLMLLGFPVGTIIGVYLLINTWRPWATPASLPA